MDERVPWDQYFMNIAQVVASRSTCPRKFVGAVIVRDRTILSTGYNGSIRGMPHCTDAGHMMENDHCVATIHAEANAIIQAAKNGVIIDGAMIYVTASPCWNCFKQIANAGVRRIVYGEFYRDERIFQVAERLGIPYVFAAYCPNVLPSPHHAPPPLPNLPGQPAPAAADSRELWARDGQRFNDLFSASLNSHRASIGLAPVSDVRRYVFTDRPWLATSKSPSRGCTRMSSVRTVG